MNRDEIQKLKKKTLKWIRLCTFFFQSQLM